MSSTADRASAKCRKLKETSASAIGFAFQFTWIGFVSHLISFDQLPTLCKSGLILFGDAW